MKGVYSPAYSMGVSPRSLQLNLGKQDDVPGPASYRTDSDTLPSAPRPTIGKSPRYALTVSSAGPGPGHYNTPHTIGQGPRAVLTARNVQDTDRSKSPGPADYVPKELNSTFSYSVGKAKKHRTLSQHEVGPGPGSYEPKAVLKATPRPTYPLSSIGRSSKDFSPSHDKVPGPGKYSLFIEKSTGFSFCKTLRTASTHMSQPPGPGSYNFETKPSSSGFSMTPRRPLTAGVPPPIPGPGAYSNPLDPLTPSFTIGHSHRFIDTSSTGPSFCDYTPVAVLNRPPSFSIGKGKRSTIARMVEAPGPGNYNPEHRTSSPRYTIQSRGATKSVSMNPVPSTQGPGQYSPKSVAKKPPITAIGKAKRSLFGESVAPAPNEYDIKPTASTPRYTFSRSKRMGESRVSLPGPGQYDFLNTVAALPSYAAVDTNRTVSG